MWLQQRQAQSHPSSPNLSSRSKTLFPRPRRTAVSSIPGPIGWSFTYENNTDMDKAYWALDSLISQALLEGLFIASNTVTKLLQNIPIIQEQVPGHRQQMLRGPYVPPLFHIFCMAWHQVFSCAKQPRSTGSDGPTPDLNQVRRWPRSLQASSKRQVGGAGVGLQKAA